MKFCDSCKNLFESPSRHNREICKKCSNPIPILGSIDSKNKKEKQRKHYLKKLYGITSEDYSKMLSKQNFCCKICKIHISKLKRSMAVDHCHKSGKIRGLLCNNCNVALGLFKDNPNILAEAIQYLLK